MSKLAYSYKEAAAVTPFSESTIKNAVRAGTLKARRPKVHKDQAASDRARVVIMHDDLMAWLESVEF